LSTCLVSWVLKPGTLPREGATLRVTSGGPSQAPNLCGSSPSPSPSPRCCAESFKKHELDNLMIIHVNGTITVTYSYQLQTMQRRHQSKQGYENWILSTKLRFPLTGLWGRGIQSHEFPLNPILIDTGIHRFKTCSASAQVAWKEQFTSACLDCGRSQGVGMQ
jgi:hypothetical protein